MNKFGYKYNDRSYEDKEQTYFFISGHIMTLWEWKNWFPEHSQLMREYRSNVHLDL